MAEKDKKTAEERRKKSRINRGKMGKMGKMGKTKTPARDKPSKAKAPSRTSPAKGMDKRKSRSLERKTFTMPKATQRRPRIKKGVMV